VKSVWPELDKMWKDYKPVAVPWTVRRAIGFALKICSFGLLVPLAFVADDALTMGVAPLLAVVLLPLAGLVYCVGELLDPREG
jgi:hypothetical protein